MQLCVVYIVKELTAFRGAWHVKECALKLQTSKKKAV